MHAEWGLLNIATPRLGCGHVWEEIHKVRPAAPLSCKVCGHGVVAKQLKRHGTRFLAHLPGGPECELRSGEGPEHQVLKQALANAAEQAEWVALLEQPSTDWGFANRSWVADVLALSDGEDGPETLRVLEAQCVNQSASEAQERTRACWANGVPRIWLAREMGHEWVAHVPALVVEGRGAEASGWWVTHGIGEVARNEAGENVLVPVGRRPLADVVRDILDEELVPFHPVIPGVSWCGWWQVVWLPAVQVRELGEEPTWFPQLCEPMEAEPRLADEEWTRSRHGGSGTLWKPDDSVDRFESDDDQADKSRPRRYQRQSASDRYRPDEGSIAMEMAALVDWGRHAWQIADRRSSAGGGQHDVPAATRLVRHVMRGGV
ncbi:hypothetical protein OV450_6908 [Actinobacteria bacterium OV450]|nr:hypothetical protein OV450_6908 [Actinobacteria bacterium OV450]